MIRKLKEIFKERVNEGSRY